MGSARFDGVFLDFGGTLVRSVPDPFEAFLPVLRAHGFAISRDQWNEADRRVSPRVEPYRYRDRGSPPSFWDRVHAATLSDLGIPDHDGAIARALRSAATSPAWHRPFPETEEVLAALRAERFSLHVVSNNTDYLLESLSRLGWSDRFDSVTYSQEAGAEKPDRRVFELALRRAGCRPERALHVGDSWESDYLGATRAGMVGVWLNRGRQPGPGSVLGIPDLRGVPSIVRRGT